jgi:hypothetical protein
MGLITAKQNPYFNYIDNNNENYSSTLIPCPLGKDKTGK